jgi:hypothetical protein
MRFSQFNSRFASEKNIICFHSWSSGIFSFFGSVSEVQNWKKNVFAAGVDVMITISAIVANFLRKNWRFSQNPIL